MKRFLNMVNERELPEKTNLFYKYIFTMYLVMYKNNERIIIKMKNYFCKFALDSKGWFYASVKKNIRKFEREKPCFLIFYLSTDSRTKYPRY